MRTVNSFLAPEVSVSDAPLTGKAKAKLATAHTHYMSRVISLAAQHMTRSKRTHLVQDDVKWAISMVEHDGGDGLLGFRSRVGEWGWRKVGRTGSAETPWIPKGRIIRKLESLIVAPYPEVEEIGICQGGGLSVDHQEKVGAIKAQNFEKLVDKAVAGGEMSPVLRFLATVDNIQGLYPGILKKLIKRLFDVISVLCIETCSRENNDLETQRPDGLPKNAARIDIMMNAQRCLRAMFLNRSPGVSVFVDPVIPALLSCIVAPCLTIPRIARMQGAEVLGVLRKWMSEQTAQRTVRTLVKAVVEGKPGGVEGGMIGLERMGDDVVSEVLLPLQCGARFEASVERDIQRKNKEYFGRWRLFQDVCI